MRKVLLLISELQEGGGTETHFETLAKSLMQDGYQVVVFTFGGPWTDYFRYQGIRIHVANTASYLNDRNLIQKEGYHSFTRSAHLPTCGQS